jgi:glycosyltransferase involved in cell wall biosynthesis
MTGMVRRVSVYHPATQHSLMLARALLKQGYDTSLITRFEARSAMRQSVIARSAYRVLSSSQVMQRAIENRSASDVPSFSTDPVGILASRFIGETIGRSAQRRFDCRRMRHSAMVAVKLMERELHPDLIVAAETGALDLLEESSMSLPIVIDVAHPHPREVDRCRRLAVARYPGLLSSWDDPPLEVSGWERLNRALARATQIWTASDYTARAVREFADPRGQIDVIGYGIPDMFDSSSPRSKYEGRYLFVGAVGLRKGVPLLLESWAKSGLAGEGCVLELVGRKLDKTIEAIAASTPGVRRHVDISSEALQGLFRQADALLSPSYCEGFGRVLIEAVSAGIPFLATRTGAVDDILGTELSEWSVEVDDLEKFTDTLLRFHGNSSSRASYSDAFRGMQGRWTERAYGVRLRSAVEKVVGMRPDRY